MVAIKKSAAAIAAATGPVSVRRYTRIGAHAIRHTVRMLGVVQATRILAPSQVDAIPSPSFEPMAIADAGQTIVRTRTQKGADGCIFAFTCGNLMIIGT